MKAVIVNKPLFMQLFLIILIFIGHGFVGVYATDHKLNQQCQLKLSVDNIEIINAENKVYWQIKPHSISPYLNNTDSVSIISPDCNWLALAGGSDYRYVWLVSRQGKKWSIKTIGTPKALAFNPQSDKLAIGTAGGQLYISDLNGSVKNHDFSYGIFNQLQYINDGKHIIAAINGGAALLNENGTPEWSRSNLEFYNASQYSTIETGPDSNWFLIVTQTVHGVYGYEKMLISNSGQEVWTEEFRSIPASMLNEAVPISEAEKIAGSRYIEHNVNHKLVEAWRDCNDDMEIDGSKDEGQKQINSMKASGFNNQEIEEIGVVGCAHLSYQTNEIKKPPAEFFIFNESK